MPTMVMSQLPKNSGDNAVVRKRQKNKTDNITAVNYMYVGLPDKPSTFYVRERMVYRSNVEVTYEDVYNYLASNSGDDTVSLHYSVNGLYVPITTTGQLHTFLQYVHNDPSALLYVENQEFVWNVAPQNKSHKMEKRVPAGAVASVDGEAEPYDSANEDDVSRDGDEHAGTEDDSQDDEEYEEEDDEEYDEVQQRIPPILTDNSAPIVFAEKIPVKEAFLEPKPRFVSKPKVFDEHSLCPNHREKRENAERSNGTGAKTPPKKWTSDQAYTQIKNLLTETLTKKSMGSVPETISEHLVHNVWNPRFRHNDQVVKDTVALLRHSISAGILWYHNQLKSKFNPEQVKKEKSESVEKVILAEYTPNCDPELIRDFIHNAFIAACDVLESVQHLAQLQKEFEYFKRQNEKHEKNSSKKQIDKDVLPVMSDIWDHMRTAVTSAHFGYTILEPVFPKSCECKETIRVLTVELQKLLIVLDNVQNSPSNPHQIIEVKMFTIESAQKVIERFKNKVCPQHANLETALRCSEAQRWRNDIAGGFYQWSSLYDTGENRLNVSDRCFEFIIERPIPYALKPEKSAGDASYVPVAYPLGDLHCTANPLTMPTDCNDPSAENTSILETTLKSFREMSTNETSKSNSNGAAGSNENQKAAVQTTTATTNVSATTTTTSTTGQAAGGGAATISKKMSAELQKLVDNMYKNVPAQHNYVYPPPPKPGAILIPTGGLARCRCSKNCPEFLMEPAYEYVERFNEPRQTVWEKTKQKRFKKN